MSEFLCSCTKEFNLSGLTQENSGWAVKISIIVFASSQLRYVQLRPKKVQLRTDFESLKSLKVLSFPVIYNYNLLFSVFDKFWIKISVSFNL